MSTIIDHLLASAEPSIRYRVRTGVLGEDPQSPALLAVQEEIRMSPRVQALLSERTHEGRIPCHPYKKWYGAHWVLATLAEIGYPPGDASLLPLRDQVCEAWLSERHLAGVKTIDGRTRRCTSQEGYALYACLTLGLADERVHQLAANLLRWQWPDGGWNCDKKPEASRSSFHETFLPLRALALYGRLMNSEAALAAARRAAEVFLARRLFRRLHDSSIMNDNFVLLHYPHYWHYDILCGLKVMAKAGFLNDPRCAEAIALLQSQQLADGGFPAGKKYYHNRQTLITGRSLVKWGSASSRKMNEWVTAEALCVLQAANCPIHA